MCSVPGENSSEVIVDVIGHPRTSGLPPTIVTWLRSKPSGIDGADGVGIGEGDGAGAGAGTGAGCAAGAGRFSTSVPLTGPRQVVPLYGIRSVLPLFSTVPLPVSVNAHAGIPGSDPVPVIVRTAAFPLS